MSEVYIIQNIYIEKKLCNFFKNKMKKGKLEREKEKIISEKNWDKYIKCSNSYVKNFGNKICDKRFIKIKISKKYYLKTQVLEVNIMNKIQNKRKFWLWKTLESKKK